MSDLLIYIYGVLYFCTTILDTVNSLSCLQCLDTQTSIKSSGDQCRHPRIIPDQEATTLEASGDGEALHVFDYRSPPMQVEECPTEMHVCGMAETIQAGVLEFFARGCILRNDAVVSDTQTRFSTQECQDVDNMVRFPLVNWYLQGHPTDIPGRACYCNTDQCLPERCNGWFILDVCVDWIYLLATVAFIAALTAGCVLCCCCATCCCQCDT